MGQEMRTAAIQAKGTYFGAVVGRCANRIARGRFELGGKVHSLAINNPPNALHGGVRGWDKRLWQGQRIAHSEGDAVRLTYTCTDSEEVRLLTGMWALMHSIIKPQSQT